MVRHDMRPIIWEVAEVPSPHSNQVPVWFHGTGGLKGSPQAVATHRAQVRLLFHAGSVNVRRTCWRPQGGHPGKPGLCKR